MMFGILSRGEIIGTAEVSLVVETCPTCGCWHAFSKSLYEKMQQDSSKAVYCPNGHSWHYILSVKEQLEEARNRARRAEARNTHLQDQYDASERSRTSLKGVITRTKNRISKGVCPCCNRYFEKLAKHIKTKHPKYITS